MTNPNCRMYTETHLYRDIPLTAFSRNITQAETSGWSVRHTEMLELVHEVKQSVDKDTLPVTVKVLTALVVYEREQF